MITMMEFPWATRRGGWLTGNYQKTVLIVSTDPAALRSTALISSPKSYQKHVFVAAT